MWCGVPMVGSDLVIEFFPPCEQLWSDHQGWQCTGDRGSFPLCKFCIVSSSQEILGVKKKKKKVKEKKVAYLHFGFPTKGKVLKSR